MATAIPIALPRSKTFLPILSVRYNDNAVPEEKKSSKTYHN